jgi:hypothetical protein
VPTDSCGSGPSLGRRHLRATRGRLLAPVACGRGTPETCPLPFPNCPPRAQKMAVRFVLVEPATVCGASGYTFARPRGKCLFRAPRSILWRARRASVRRESGERCGGVGRSWQAAGRTISAKAPPRNARTRQRTASSGHRPCPRGRLPSRCTSSLVRGRTIRSRLS